MKLKEIKQNEEFIAEGHIFCFSIEEGKAKFKYIRKHDGKVKSNFTPPTQHEVMEYFFEKGYESLPGATAWEYYNELGWKDSNDKPIKNWKAKMLSVWMKPENKLKPKETEVKAQMVR